MRKLGLLSETQYADELSYIDRNLVFLLESARLLFYVGINRNPHYMGALVSIMFNGRQLKEVVLFKKDVVSPEALESRDFMFASEFRKCLEAYGYGYK